MTPTPVITVKVRALNGAEHDVPAIMCGTCPTLMPAARLRHGIESCEHCTEQFRNARPALPEFETDVWARGGRL